MSMTFDQCIRFFYARKVNHHNDVSRFGALFTWFRADRVPHLALRSVANITAQWFAPNSQMFHMALHGSRSTLLTAPLGPVKSTIGLLYR